MKELKAHELAELDYVNGMKYKDIAQKYNVSINTVKCWKQRYEWNKKDICTNEKGVQRGKYKEWLKQENLMKIEGWARDGLTDEQIAYNMGIGTTTLYRWKNEHREIRETLKKGKEVIDRQVENSLLKRALGYEYDEVTQEIDKETGQLRVTKIVTKQVVPDTTAQIFWLKNRKPNEWREKRDVEMSGEVKTNPFEELTTEELKKLARDI